jgi:hypothetical protein
MIEHLTLPPDLRTVIGSETRDFAVKAARAQPLKVSLTLVIFGIIWILFSSIFVVGFFGPLFAGQDVEMTVNGVPTTAGPGHMGPLVMPGIIIGVFLLVGIAVLWFGLYLLTREGGYFVGTPARLISYRKGTILSIDWEQFSGHIEMKGSSKKGSIALQLRSGRMVSSKSGPERYVPDVVYMTSIPGIFEVEKICRQRIRENDPTPPSL